MIEKVEGLSVLKQRDYITAEIEACDILRNNGYIASGSTTKLGEAVDIFKPISTYNNEFIGEYKNFQEAKEALIGQLY